ncbi:MAG: hypothetical protein R2689_02170 [Microthrixaceae bacterium]
MNGLDWSTSLSDVVVCACAGFIVAMALWAAMQDAFVQQTFLRTNYRGHQLPTAVGVLIVVPYALVVGLSSWLNWDLIDGAALALVLGFGVLGLLDDVGGAGESGGFRGHLRALAAGRLTTGGLKMLGGPVVALAVTGDLLVAAIVCLAANLANLFDRAPGRTTKVSLLAFGLIALAGWTLPPASVALVIGAAAGLLWGDLNEQFMMGDAGSNVIGAVIGVQLVAAFPSTSARWITLAVLVAFNIASEFVSFSKIIASTPPLRALDLLGARRRPR